MCRLGFDILCISEHWLHSDEFAHGLSINQWQLVTYFSRKNHIHGGVAIFVKRELNCVVLDVSDICVEIDCEVCALYCEYFDVVVACIYRSPDGNFESFVDIVECLLSDIIVNYKHVIITGDFNVKFGTSDMRAGRICNLFASYGYSATVNEPTRQNNCLDNIFVNFEVDSCKTLVVDTGLSDHSAQTISVKVDLIEGCKDTATITRPLTEVGFCAFFEYFSDYAWDFLCDPVVELNGKMIIFSGGYC